MSRRDRRAGASGRRATSAGGSGGRSIPVLPLAVVAGAAILIALVAYLIWQNSQSSSASTKWTDLEADPAPDLPGEHVNLPEIYGNESGLAHYGRTPGTAPHVRADVDYVEDGNSNPPAGGPHWGSSACSDDADSSSAFCGPARLGIYRAPWPPETLIHNMEHAGVVVWYNTTDQAIIDELEEIIRDGLNRGDQLVLTPYFDMEEETVALTSWARIDKFPVSEYTRDRIQDYIDVHDRRFNPEGF